MIEAMTGPEIPSDIVELIGLSSPAKSNLLWQKLVAKTERKELTKIWM